MRFDASSPKDSCIKMLYQTPLDIIHSIITSRRAYNVLMDGVHSSVKTKIYFVEFDLDWKPERELRCFVYKRKLTAISQYNWSNNKQYL
ncbi:hypothetical protein QLL95_gp0307 [Cotonvirus japonicus]|uniref:Uncharacterized protein n=1 Tax=Cotonvirus japonicus TaxID=2811091 RepID=A0ABM7NRS3_9VIRU|nr:hypothetical protein QLL95_gp0307 [Cotonvirus japonicus]BCS82796.1 hypothetical protein [Cotonvirus japonicus]